MTRNNSGMAAIGWLDESFDVYMLAWLTQDGFWRLMEHTTAGTVRSAKMVGNSDFFEAQFSNSLGLVLEAESNL